MFSRQMLARGNLLLILASILPWSAAGNDGGFQFPTQVSSPIGAKLVDVDLIRLQASELEAAQQSVRKMNRPARFESDVSSILQKQNQKMIRELYAVSVPKGLSQAVNSISRSQAQSLVRKLRSHPVTSEAATRKFDSEGKQTGFCFGRAAFVHLELLRRGVHPESIGKIFAVGGLMAPAGGIWDYHVSTVVRRSEGGWWAIDGLSAQPLVVEDWVKSITKMAFFPRQPTLRFYFTDAVKFLPTRGAYSENNLYVPLYKGYFTSLRDWFIGNPLQKGESYLGQKVQDFAEKTFH